ncbi:carbamoyl phosphate synthase small subunit [Virgibacillus senegalensis]|uniref:carbamoyl phosphate synthase small subunit n=1 Tax=Virgibacillus senegalensis TaxID=1499679 RepID=UPI00069E827A|nr:carbamoyl phosphate synthase small subunit [Virgibacillus senegalensis]
MFKRQLVLEDGTSFIGKGFGSDRQISGEVVFNTGMTGYQEILSDPSYCGQLVTMTYPLIGNYGINRDDFESITPSVHGLIVKEACDSPSNYRSEETLDRFLKAHDIPGLAGIDTRKLTRLIRNHGTMRGLFTSADHPVTDALQLLEQQKVFSNHVERVSTVKPYVVPGRGRRIVLVDFGMKHGILRELTKRNCHITVVPYHYSAEKIRRLKPEGVMLSNGPGDPKHVQLAIQMIKEIISDIPIFGICLGHQLIALACGANTEKLRFGHRGSNHPVKDLQTGKTVMTSQNHGYTVTKESLADTDLELTQIALNDGTVEGLTHIRFPTFSVQYHPESSPGPEDTYQLFDRFIANIDAHIPAENKEEERCQSVLI